MKKLFFPVILCLILILLAACGGKQELQTEDSGFSKLFGNWANSDGSYTLQINDVGQVWYLSNGELLFRGYLEQIELSKNDFGYEHRFRYDLYSDAEEFMMCYYYDSASNTIIEANSSGDIFDTYEYQGEFSID